MFPFDVEEDVSVVEKEDAPYREYEIDYHTGQLTGRVVEGAEAVKVWIYFALNTDRYCFPQYSWNYGSELNTLVGGSSDLEYICMNARRMAEECLMQNPHITRLRDFKADVEEERIHVFFVVETDFGEVEMNV